MLKMDKFINSNWNITYGNGFDSLLSVEYVKDQTLAKK